MKTCARCKDVKDSSKFYRLKSRNDGLHPYCKDCMNSEKLKQRRTRYGVVKTLHNNKKGSRYNMKLTIDELYEWMIGQDKFEELYINWVNSGYKKDMTPSIDRISDYGEYTLDNMQLMAWIDNRKKGHADQVAGRNTKCTKAVIDGDGNEYYSIAEAVRRTGFRGISNCVRGDTKTSGGTTWRYQ